MTTEPVQRRPAEDSPKSAWITALKRGLDELFRAVPDVFVAANLPWYPLQGDDGSRLLPALMVVFGRPKGGRDAYRPWEEGGIVPQVVFEIRPLDGRLERRLRRFERLGVEEYYVLDVVSTEMTGWVSTSIGMELVHRVDRWVSPRLGVRIDPATGELRTGPPPDVSPSIAEPARQRDERKREYAELKRQTDEYRRLAVRLAARLRELGEKVE